MSYRLVEGPRKLGNVFDEAMRWCNNLRVPISNYIELGGWCKRKDFYAITERKANNRFVIYFSTLAYDYCGHDEQKWLDLMLHEFAHTVRGCYNHRAKWKAIVRRFNLHGASINPKPYSCK